MISQSSKAKIHGILFDLDGTLLDTAPDLAATLNALLLDQHRQPLTLASIRPKISDGVAGLLKLGFNITHQHTTFSHLYQQFIDYYKQHICDHTQLFPHISTVIHFIQENQLAWGIVTNKSEALTTKLLDHFPLLQEAQCIITGDTLPYAKPHPQPLLHACTCIHCIPQNCLYIGDAKRDIEAANAAQMPSLLALYGYISHTDDPSTWHASAMIDTPLAIIEWLKQP